MTTPTGIEVFPIAILGQYKEGDILYPAAQVLDVKQNVAFDPIFVASSLISLYEAFLNSVPDNKQIEFEEQFRFYLNRMFVDKEQYITKL